MKNLAMGAHGIRTRDGAAEILAEILDALRSRCLRLTMALEWLRPIFYRRYLRLAVSFAFSCVLSLGLALAFPLWMLFIGPLVYGIPHIYASMRYVHFAAAGRPEPASASVGARAPWIVQGRRMFAVVMLILCLDSAYRVFVTLNVLQLNVPQLSEWKGANYVELIALGLTFFAGAWIYQSGVRRFLRGLWLVIPFATVFIRFPLETIGVMVLAHNFVAFPFWIRASESRAEKRVAWVAFFATVGITTAIFLGGFDWAYHLIPPSQVLDFANMSVESTGRLIAPHLDSPAIWLHASIAFAFGQALHYFVWLKAIPDQFHYHETPTSFRQSLKLLERDFGRVAARGAVWISLGAIVFWSFISFQLARYLYFALASYHGYLEIAGLALAKPRGKSPSIRSGMDRSIRDRGSASAHPAPSLIR